MKTRIALCALTLGVLAVACDDQAHNYSAISPTPPAPTAPVIAQGQTPVGLPVVPQVPTGPIRGGKGGNPTPPKDAHDNDGPHHSGGSSNSGGSSGPSVTKPRPEKPGPDISGGDVRDGGRRLEDSTCESIRALTGRWSVKVDDHWDALKRGTNKWVKQKLEERSARFFSDALCDGLRTLRSKNAKVAKLIEQRIGDQKLEILLTDDDEAGNFDKHRFHIFWVIGVGKPQIKLGRRVVEGVIASELPDWVDILAPSDSQLTREAKINRDDILASQIQAAKATFFHYVMHMAGAEVQKGPHTNDSFLLHEKELDVIHACTAQAYPYFYVDAESNTGPFYKNSKLACETCASASTVGAIHATLDYVRRDISPEVQILCNGIKDRDPEMIVMPDRSANLYEEMK